MPESDRTSTHTDLPVSDLDTTLADKTRCKRDPATIERYAAILDDLPPIEVYQVGTRLLVTDGAHRVAAAQECGRTTLPALLLTGRTEHEAWLAAITANQEHGLPLKAADRRKILSLLLDDPRLRKRSDRWLADLIGCSPTTVGDLRREREQIGAIPTEPERTTRDGTTIHVPTPQAPATVGDPVQPTDACADADLFAGDHAVNPNVQVVVRDNTGSIGNTGGIAVEKTLPGDTSRTHALTRAVRSLIAEQLRTGASCIAPMAALQALALRWGLTASTRCHDICRQVLLRRGMALDQTEELTHTPCPPVT